MWSLGMNNIAIQFELSLDLVELNSNSIKFNSTIGVKFNWKQMGLKFSGNGFQNLLVNMVLENKNTSLKLHLSMFLYLGMG
jgi:hypothetical protein